MCSVIEIKNADEYYIRYHSPESMDMTNGDKKKKKSGKDKSAVDEVTSDRCSSTESTTLPSMKAVAGSSTTGSSAAGNNAAGSGSEDGNTTSCTSGHQSDVARAASPPSSKVPVTDEDIIKDLIKNKLIKGPDQSGMSSGHQAVSAEVTSDRGSSAGSSVEDAVAKRFQVLPPDGNTKVTQGNVPITVNSHIPASPHRLVKATNTTATAQKTDAGTQMDAQQQKEVQKVVTRGQVSPRQEVTSVDAGGKFETTKENVTEEIERRRLASEQKRLISESKSLIVTKETTIVKKEVSKSKKESVSKLPVFLQESQRPVVKPVQTKSSIPVPTTSPSKKKSSILKKVSSMSGAKDHKTTDQPKQVKDHVIESMVKAVEEKEKSNGRKLSLKREKKKDKMELKSERDESKERSKSTKRSFLTKKKSSQSTSVSDTELSKPDKTRLKTPDTGHKQANEPKLAKKKPRSTLDKNLVKKCLSMDRIDQMFHKRTPSETAVDPLNLHHPRFSKHGKGVRADVIRDGTSSCVSEGEASHKTHIIKKTKDGYVVFGPGKKWNYSNGKHSKRLVGGQMCKSVEPKTVHQ